MNQFLKARIASIDYFKSYAALAVILIHSQPFKGAFERFLEGQTRFAFIGAIEFGVNICVRSAVPFFFVIAGYLFGRNVSKTPHVASRLFRALKRLGTVWLVWSFLYVIIPDYFDALAGYRDPSYWASGYGDRIMQRLSFLVGDPLHLLQGTGHLWFFPALIFALSTVALFYRMRMVNFLLIATGAILIAVLASSTYAFTPPGRQLADVMQNYPWLRSWVIGQAPTMFYVAAGMWFALKKINLTRGYSLGLIGAGLVVSAAEVLMLISLKHTKAHVLDIDGLAGTAMLAIGVALHAVSNPEIGRGGMLERWGRGSMGIYIVHPIFIEYVMPIGVVLYIPGWDLAYPILIYFVSLVLVLALSKNKWLRRVVF